MNLHSVFSFIRSWSACTQLTAAVEYGASRPVDINFREVPGNSEAHDEYKNMGPRGALSSNPLGPSDGPHLNIPVAYSTLSIYVNIPGGANTLGCQHIKFDAARIMRALPRECDQSYPYRLSRK
eukprot:1160541-Pelagomonas_calceolata.AAC.2